MDTLSDLKNKKYKPMKNIAIILGGGAGKRFGEKIPKQFLMINHKMIIEHTIETFQTHPEIDEMIVALPENYLHLSDRLSIYTKITTFIKGGSERYHSTLHTLKVLENHEEANLLFHDAVRPFVSHTIISEVIQALQNHKAVVVAAPATDTILEVNENKIITDIPDRKKIYHAQTPQAFRLSLIQKAFQMAQEDCHFLPTDDGSVVFRYLPDENIVIIHGEEKNRKITFKEDLALL
jgi:2-C-methyl-D-erythritol 4-phosphate cytidylyltransferase